MRIEMWADIANPWTHVAAERLRVALAAGDVAAEVVWRPLLTDAADPDAPRDALRLLVLAEERGGVELQGRVAAELLASHDVRDLAELAAVADRAGFPDAGALLASDAGHARLRELLLIGKARGITISPTLADEDRLLEFAMSPATIGEFLGASDGPDAADAPDASADRAANQAARRLPPEVERLRWADELLALNDPLGALVLLEPLLAEHAQDPNIRRVAASAYFASAQLGRARQVLEATLADHPSDSYARLMLGRTLERQGHADEAGTHLRMAAAMTPEYA
ncbi:tetratricopeptide repeat protein [Catenulispora rubra]|uniref:tetratricopeptide repeat protein n=1 Tax=Catenulispora rubra TaxID=280293 RepID=UPI0018926C99|nr:tetratricopeptide repeat protein [Catenulispora rubra]